MIIPKYPEVPRLTDNQIEELTEIVFCKETEFKNNDVIFVFGTTHPGSYENALQAYKKGLGKEIIISGGTSGSPDKHKDWIYGDKSEARVLFEKLVAHGVPIEKMVIEDKSTNSMENVIFSKEIYDFSKTKSIIFISKNYASGRQLRTLKKYLPNDIHYTAYGYNIYFDDETTFDRHDWMKYDKSKSLVFGEYLRILFYGKLGYIEELSEPIKGLEKYTDPLFY